MSKTIKICSWCYKEFLVENREVNRGGGKFCSRTCSANYGNLYKHPITKICKFCEKQYETNSKKSLYCSKLCITHAKRSRTIKAGSKYINRSTLQRRIIKKLGPSNFKCFICNWNEAMCDIHHIKPKSLGGSSNFSNLTVLCPNHHRLAERDILSTLPSVSERYRTISSSNTI